MGSQEEAIKIIVSQMESVEEDLIEANHFLRNKALHRGSRDHTIRGIAETNLALTRSMLVLLYAMKYLVLKDRIDGLKDG